MTQNPCSASPADSACLNVRSTERTFIPAPQLEVTHQINCASRAHTPDLRPKAPFHPAPVRALHSHGRDNFHVVPDISLYATRPQESRPSSRTEPAIPFCFPEVLYPA